MFLAGFHYLANRSGTFVDIAWPVFYYLRSAGINQAREAITSFSAPTLRPRTNRHCLLPQWKLIKTVPCPKNWFRHTRVYVLRCLSDPKCVLTSKIRLLLVQIICAFTSWPHEINDFYSIIFANRKLTIKRITLYKIIWFRNINNQQFMFVHHHH